MSGKNPIPWRLVEDNSVSPLPHGPGRPKTITNQRMIGKIVGEMRKHPDKFPAIFVRAFELTGIFVRAFELTGIFVTSENVDALSDIQKIRWIRANEQAREEEAAKAPKPWTPEGE